MTRHERPLGLFLRLLGCPFFLLRQKGLFPCFLVAVLFFVTHFLYLKGGSRLFYTDQLLLVAPPVVLQRAGNMTPLRVVMCPVNDTAL